MAADQPDRDDEAPRTSAAEPGDDPTAGPTDDSPGTPTDDGRSDLDHERRTDAGETRGESVADDQAVDGGSSVSSADTEIRPVTPDLSRPDRVGPESTSTLPSVPDVPGAPRWSARASVRTPDIADEEHDDWAEPPRGLLVPMLVTVCILLLVALIGLGGWLIFASRPSGPPASTPTVQNATPPATTGAQTTTTTTTATSPSPALVSVPDLRGLDYGTAAADLTKLGFTPVRRDEVDSGVPEGKVIGTEPTAGSSVHSGTSVVIIVSLGPPDASPSPTAEPGDTPT